MQHVFYIEAIRLVPGLPGTVVVDSVEVLSEQLGQVKRQARVLADTAADQSWNWPIAQAIRVTDENGREKFRCWLRIPLRSRKCNQISANTEIQVEAA